MSLGAPAPLPAGVLPPVAAGEGLDHLLIMYSTAEANIENAIRTAAMRQQAGTASYYRLQLLRVQAELARLQHAAVPLARTVVQHAYVAGARAVDVSSGVELTAWDGVNRGAMNRLTAALAAPLQRISLTVGRQATDAYRQAGLLESGVGLASGQTRAQTATRIADNLSRQGITGFVDRSGRRWKMSTYASMVARTTTREAVTQGTVDRMGAHDMDLIEIDEHDGSCEICIPYEGQVYSLSGNDPTYPPADELPPFHPQCEHTASPSDVGYSDFIAALQGGSG